MARLYSDTEIAALLARAAERQQAAPADGPVSGLTLDEIERLAADAGLDPAHVRAAAADLDGRAPATPSAHGLTTHERWLDVPFSEVGWEEAVMALRPLYGTNMATYNATGTMSVGADVSRVGAAHEWTHAAMSGATTTVTVSPRGDRTRVRIVSRSSVLWNDPATAGLYGLLAAILPAFAVFVGVIKTVDSGWLALAAVLATLAAGTALAATLGAPAVRRSRERKARRAEDTLNLVVRSLEEAAEASPAPDARRDARREAQRDAAGRVDFDAAVGDADEDAPDAGRARRREAS